MDVYSHHSHHQIWSFQKGPFAGHFGVSKHDSPKFVSPHRGFAKRQVFLMSGLDHGTRKKIIILKQIKYGHFKTNPTNMKTSLKMPDSIRKIIYIYVSPVNIPIIIYYKPIIIDGLVKGIRLPTFGTFWSISDFKASSAASFLRFRWCKLWE